MSRPIPTDSWRLVMAITSPIYDANGVATRRWIASVKTTSQQWAMWSVEVCKVGEFPLDAVIRIANERVSCRVYGAFSSSSVRR